MGLDLDGERQFDRSGKSTALSRDGNTVCIGGAYNNGVGVDSGHVRVYTFVDDVWEQVGSDIEGEKTGWGFGRAVAINGNGSLVSISAAGNDEVILYEAIGPPTLSPISNPLPTPPPVSPPTPVSTACAYLWSKARQGTNWIYSIFKHI